MINKTSVEAATARWGVAGYATRVVAPGEDQVIDWAYGERTVRQVLVTPQDGREQEVQPTLEPDPEMPGLTWIVVRADVTMQVEAYTSVGKHSLLLIVDDTPASLNDRKGSALQTKNYKEEARIVACTGQSRHLAKKLRRELPPLRRMEIIRLAVNLLDAAEGDLESAQQTVRVCRSLRPTELRKVLPEGLRRIASLSRADMERFFDVLERLALPALAHHR